VKDDARQLRSTDAVNRRPWIVKALVAWGVIVVSLCAMAGAANAHFGQGNATPSNGGGNPKASHPNWSDDYCTKSLNGFPGSFDYRHSCVHHDGCYTGFPDANGRSVYWAGKAQCDAWFYNDLKATCGEQHPGLLNAVSRRECLNLAWVYLKAVERFGNYNAPHSRPAPGVHQPIAALPMPNYPEHQPLTPIAVTPVPPVTSQNPPTGSTPAPPRTWREQQGSLGANTFTNPYNASGMGTKIQPNQWVDVVCKVHAPQIASANPDGYWYRIASAPWNGNYYAVANTFWNGDIPGVKPYTHNTDMAVANC